ncbi:MAG: sigma-70 family RNA polymerase sigma factor [Elusimicrobia bacterium]|nr:sigma-70 family RNA polymerase sigma factor [Elusimicrobiota bacterium]
MQHPDRQQLAAQENRLVSRFLGGDAEAFSGLVELYKDRVHQFIICILGPDREAEDIAQEVFIQVYKSLAGFRSEASFSTWVYSVARNVCRRRLRDRGRAGALFADTGSESGLKLPDTLPLPDASFEKKEAGGLVRAAVEALSPLHRSVIFLSCWERLSYEEIAGALDIPVGTVRSRIHNAMAALAQKLKPVLNSGTEVG